MSNAKRPSTARKVTPADEKKRHAELDNGVRLTLDEGKTWHTLRIGDVTPELAREIRSVTGRGFMSLVHLVGADPDLDVIQEAVWAARRIAGDDIELSDVAIDYGVLMGDDFDVEVAEPSGSEAGSPEA
jgi:hypothetical protein